ncbi:MAG TPA: hypothetical protein VFX24_02890 [Ktedonobacterales bacterium]|nr:hypothetical protein [Ktedonobacterales bacterium]
MGKDKTTLAPSAIGRGEPLAQVFGKSVEGHLAAHHLFNPNTHLSIIEAYLKVQMSQKPIDPQKGHSTDIASPLVTINEWMVESNTDHVERSLGDKVSASIIGGILRALNGTLQQSSLAQECGYLPGCSCPSQDFLIEGNDFASGKINDRLPLDHLDP